MSLSINPDPKTIPAGALTIMDVPPNPTDDEIRDMMRTMRDCRHASPTGEIVCLLSGFDDDRRELWEIPEAKKVCERLVRLGFISYLEPSTRLAAAMKGELDPSFGALEIWQIAEGKFKAKQTLAHDQIRTFFVETLTRSNEVAEVEIGPFQPQGV